MGILTKEVEVRPRGSMIQYYKDKGYDAKYNQPIMVKVEDLPIGSDIKIQYSCDYCHEEILTPTYGEYVRRTRETNKMACRHCFPQKVKEVSLLRYGASNYAKTKECHDKMKDTLKSLYGVEHNSQLPDYKDKYNSTCIDRYGESYKQQFAEKAFESFREKTGYDFPSQSPEVREKMIQTSIKHYGCENPSQSQEVREKMAKTLYTNSSQKASKQQRYINNLYQGVLNFPISRYSVDICFPEDKIVLEYDGGFHDGQVKTGKLTKEEFNRKELIRDKVVKSEGYKIVRIKSDLDRLPQDTILLQMLSDAKHYFATTQHTWQTYDIDQSLLFNAEHKDGIPYNFGSLRTIKDSDLNAIKDIS